MPKTKKKNKQFSLEEAFQSSNVNEIAPALAAVAPALGKMAASAAPHVAASLGQAAAKKLQGESDDLEEVVTTTDIKQEACDDDVQEALNSMMENALSEEERLDELIGTAFDMAKGGVQAATGLGKSIAAAPMSIAKSALTGEGQELEEDGYPEKGNYPTDKPVYPKVNEEKEELEEDGFPSNKAYPADKPHYPRVVESRSTGARFMMIPVVKESALNETGQAGAMLKGLISQAGNILSQVDPETIGDILNSFTQMAQGIMRAKQQAGRQTVEGLVREDDSKKLEAQLQQMLSQMQLPPGMTDQEIEAFGNKAVNILKTNRQLSGAKWDSGQATQEPRTSSSLPKDPASWKADSQMRDFKSLLHGEGKTYKISKGQLKNLMKEAILANKKKVLAEQVVQNTLKEQVQVRNLAQYYLTEGPLSTMWQGAKNLGRGLAGGAKAAAQGAQQAMAQGREQDQVKQAQKMAQDALKAVSKAKDKFSQETLKSTSLMNQYHDAVMNLATQVIPQLKGAMPGPALMQFKDQVDQAVGQLHYDLSSEKEGIESFLKNLQQNVPYASASQQGKKAKERADKSREEEAQQYGQTKIGQMMASPGLRRR